MPNPTLEKYKQISAFRELIASTIKALKLAQTPHELATAIDGKLPAWEASEKDFAELLKDLRGKAFILDLPHVRAVASKVCDHLQANLDRIDRELKRV